MERRLRLVDEDGAGRVHRPEADDAFANAGLAHERDDAIGDVGELDALLRLYGQRLAADDQAAASLPRPCPGGASRAFTVELLLIDVNP